MSEKIEIEQGKKKISSRAILLILAMLLSPLICCGGTYLLEIIPDSLLPPIADMTVNLFEEDVQVENRSKEIVYVTSITTTRGKPEVIGQLSYIKQRDIPIKPGDSVLMTYDMADMPLSGIAVCRAEGDCRLLAVDQKDVYFVDSIEDLPRLEEDWLLAIQSTPQNNFGIVIYPILGFVPIALFAIWLYLTIKERKAKS